MEIGRIEPAEVSLGAVSALGLQSDALELDSAAATASSVQRAASFLCPTPPGVLSRAVADAVDGLPGLPPEERRSAINSAIEALVALGDLIELPADELAGRSRRHLYLGPPSYISRSSDCILLGVRPEGAPILSEEHLDRVEFRDHLRLIRRRQGSEDLDAILAGEGLIELRSEQWLNMPRQCAPEELIDLYAVRLDAAGSVGEIDELRVIDPSSDVTFYRGRWRALSPADNGRFVARRPQAYGAELWCFAEVLEGNLAKLIDLPIVSSDARGSDEAWRLQSAIDRRSAQPQRLRIRRGAPGGPVLELFSPLPSWSQRRLQFVGAPAPRSGGALFSYALPESEIDEEARVLTETLWLEVEEMRNGDDG